MVTKETNKKILRNVQFLLHESWESNRKPFGGQRKVEDEKL